MRLLADFIRIVFVLNLLPIGMSRAQDDVSTEEPQPDQPAQEDVDKNESKVEPTSIESPQPAPPAEEAAQAAPAPSEAAQAAPMPSEAAQTEASTDELIIDPELSAIAPRQQTDSNLKGIGEPCPPPGEVIVLLRSRFAADLEWEEREEVWEANQLFLIETNLRTSERLRFSAGLRLRHQFAALESDTTEAESTRFRFNAMPTAGYADATLTDGLHLRAGFQMIQIGPMNVFSASNFLAATDLRDGPTIMPEAAEIAQLALRVDADPLSWLSLRAFYLPFYQSHLVSSTESDYAQFPASRVEEIYQNFVDPRGADVSPDQIEQAYEEYRQSIKEAIPRRAARSRMLDAGNAAFLPEPDFTDPQGALRIAAHGVEGEVGITAGTAIERLPTTYMPPDLIEAIRNQQTEFEENDDIAVHVFYDRFYLFALDASTDVGPIQLGIETSYQFDRVMVSVPRDFWPRNLRYYDALLEDGAWPLPGKTDLVQFNLNGEFLEGSEWMVVLEGIFMYSLYVPYAPDREWLSLHQGRYLVGGAAHMRWSPSDSGWTFEVSSVVTNGVNYLVAPRIETRLVSELYAEVGAFLVGTSGPSGNFIRQEIVTGYLYEGIDQAFVGLRWLP
jgi:hypothetical protein